MAKKLLKDYTPEQRFKLERRLLLLDLKKNPETQNMVSTVILDSVGANTAREEAVRFRQASETMGRAAFRLWCAENPLSQRAALHLSMIEQELAAPAVEHGKKFTKRKSGAIADHTKEIHKLAKQFPETPAKQLQSLATHPKAKSMKPERFSNVVSEARRSIK